MTDIERDFTWTLYREGQFHIYLVLSFSTKADQATVEELAEWTFGDLETALKSYREFRKVH